MFVGFELAAALGEETAEPARSIPTAIIATILICGALLRPHPVRRRDRQRRTGRPRLRLRRARRPLRRRLARARSSSWPCCSTSSPSGIGFTAGTSRGLFTLARDGLLPSPAGGGEPSGRADDGHAGRRRVGARRGPRSGWSSTASPPPRTPSGVVDRAARRDRRLHGDVDDRRVRDLRRVRAPGDRRHRLLRLPRPRAGRRARRIRRAGDRRRRRRGAVHRRHRVRSATPAGAATSASCVLGVVLVWLVVNMLANRDRVRAAGDRARRHES